MSIYLSKCNAGIITSSGMDAFYNKKGTFEDVVRVTESKINYQSGIKYFHAKVKVDLGKDFFVVSKSKEEPRDNYSKKNYYSSHFSLGISVKLKMNHAKNNTAISHPDTVYPIAFKKLESHGFIIGVFGNLHYKHNKGFIASLLTGIGISFYEQGDYTFMETVAVDNFGHAIIKTKKDLGGHLAIKPILAFMVSSNLYVGAMFNFEVEFAGSEELRKDTVFVSHGSQNYGASSKLPSKKSSEFYGTMLNGRRNCYNLILVYLRN